MQKKCKRNSVFSFFVLTKIRRNFATNFRQSAREFSLSQTKFRRYIGEISHQLKRNFVLPKFRDSENSLQRNFAIAKIRTSEISPWRKFVPAKFREGENSHWRYFHKAKFRWKWKPVVMKTLVDCCVCCTCTCNCLKRVFKSKGQVRW